MSISRILSLIVAGLYLLVPFIAYLGGDKKILMVLLGMLAFLALPLVCIWYGDEMGQWVGVMRLQVVGSPSPGWAIRFMSWVLLLLPIILGIVGIVRVVTG